MERYKRSKFMKRLLNFVPYIIGLLVIGIIVVLIIYMIYGTSVLDEGIDYVYNYGTINQNLEPPRIQEIESTNLSPGNIIQPFQQNLSVPDKMKISEKTPENKKPLFGSFVDEPDTGIHITAYGPETKYDITNLSEKISDSSILKTYFVIPKDEIVSKQRFQYEQLPQFSLNQFLLYDNSDYNIPRIHSGGSVRTTEKNSRRLENTNVMNNGSIKNGSAVNNFYIFMDPKNYNLTKNILESLYILSLGSKSQ